MKKFIVLLVAIAIIVLNLTFAFATSSITMANSPPGVTYARLDLINYKSGGVLPLVDDIFSSGKIPSITLESRYYYSTVAPFAAVSYTISSTSGLSDATCKAITTATCGFQGPRNSQFRELLKCPMVSATSNYLKIISAAAGTSEMNAATG